MHMEVWRVKVDVVNPFRDGRKNEHFDPKHWPVWKAGTRFYLNKENPVEQIQVPGKYGFIGNFKKSHPDQAKLFQLIMANSERVEVSDVEWMHINNFSPDNVLFRLLAKGIVTREQVQRLYDEEIRPKRGDKIEGDV